VGLCALAHKGGADEVAKLLEPAGAYYRALAESTRAWPSRPERRSGLQDESAEDSPDLAAGRAIAAVAAQLCGAGTHSVQNLAAHWEQARLPVFDRGLPFSSDLYAGLDGSVRSFIAMVESASDVTARGFLTLLALELSGRQLPPQQKVSLPVLFDRRAGGGTGVLRFETRSDGPPGLHPDPAAMAFFVGDDDFQEAARSAWTNSSLRTTNVCVTWSLRESEVPCIDVRQGSLGVAFAIGLHEIHRRRRLRSRFSPLQLDARCAVTGGIDAEAINVTPVTGYTQKLMAARAAKLRRVVVPAISRSMPDFPPSPPGVRVVGAATVRQALARTRRRPNPRFLVLTVALLSVVTVAAKVAWDQTLLARQEQRGRTAQALLTEADGLRVTDPRTALQLNVAAMELDPTRQTMHALVNAATTTGPVPLPPLSGLGQRAFAVAYSPDGKTLAVGGMDGGLWLWDMTNRETPTRVSSLSTGSTGIVIDLEFSPDGTTLAAGGEFSGILLWDVTTPGVPHRMEPGTDGYDEWTEALAFSPDGRTLVAVGADGNLRIWDLVGRTEARLLATTPASSSGVGEALAFSPDGRTLVVGGYAREIYFWDVSDRPDPARIDFDGEEPRTHSFVSALDYSPDGSLLAVGNYDGTVSLWDTTARRPRLLEPALGDAPGHVESVVFSPDSRTLAVGSEGDGTRSRVWLWDITNRNAPQRSGQALRGPSDEVNAMDFSPDGHTLAAASFDQRVWLWDLGRRARPIPVAVGPQLPADGGAIVAFAPDSGTLAAGSQDGAWLWQVPDWSHPTTVDLPGNSEYVWTTAFSPDGRILATGSTDDLVRLWDVTDRSAPELLGVPLTGPSNYVQSLAFSPDGRTLAAADGDGAVWWWNLAQPSHPVRSSTPFTVPDNALYAASSIMFSTDNRTIAAGGNDGTVRLWDTVSRAQTLLKPPDVADVPAVAFTPDGHILAAGGDDGRIWLWDTSDPRSPRRLTTPLVGPDTSAVRSLTYDAHGVTLVVGGDDGQIYLFDVSGDDLPVQMGPSLAGPSAEVLSVAIAPDGRSLAALGEDDHIWLWDMSPLIAARSDPVKVTCEMTEGGLDQAAWRRYLPGLDYRETCPT